MANRQPDFWFTTKSGKHIPVFQQAGESKQDAIKRTAKGAFNKKTEDTKTESKHESEKTQSTENSKKKDALQKASETITSKESAEGLKKLKEKYADDKKQSEMNDAKKRADALNAEDKYRDTLKAGSKIGRKGNNLTFNGKPIEKLDTSEAEPDGKDSLSKHVKNGELSPERAELHRKIIEDYFKDKKPYAPGDEKVAMFTGGGGASGKGVFTKEKDGVRNIGKYYSQDKNPMIIDPDAVKKKLMEADGVKMSPEMAAHYHEESSSLAKQIYSTAIQNNYPVLYDGTATGGGIFKLLDKASAAGYKTEMNFLFSDWNTVRQNSLDRYAGGFDEKRHPEGPRLVPLAQVMGAHSKAFDAVEKLQYKVDKLTLWDNAGRRMTKVGESSGPKQKLNITDKDAYKRFSFARKEFMVDTDRIDAYNRDVWNIEARLGKGTVKQLANERLYDYYYGADTGRYDRQFDRK